jgi:hypothetical protein
VEQYLELAASLTELLAGMPGVIPLDAPEHRLKAMGMWLSRAEREIAEIERRQLDVLIVYRDLAGISLAISTVGAFLEPVASLADEHQQDQCAEAAARFLKASRAFATPAQRNPRPQEGTPSGGVASPASSSSSAPAAVVPRAVHPASGPGRRAVVDLDPVVAEVGGGGGRQPPVAFVRQLLAVVAVLDATSAGLTLWSCQRWCRGGAALAGQGRWVSLLRRPSAPSTAAAALRRPARR